MAVKLSDLSPAARAQVEAQLGTKGDRGRKLSDAEVKEPGLPIRCHQCQLVFTSYDNKGGWAQHAERSGHHRADIILDHASG